MFNDETLAKHLSGMIRFKTVSNIKTELMDLNEFNKLHKYLEETYSLIHKELNKEVIGSAGLLYKWSGILNNEPPIMLCAHQDVVPEGDLSKWNNPPFEGTIKDGYVLGRGTEDCKSKILAIMEAVEKLLEEGYKPKNDIYLGFGFNEEVGGGDESSAEAICKTLKDKGVKLGLLVDEGRGPAYDNELNKKIVYINTSEKGYVDYVFTVKGKGGHSSAPSDENVIVKMSELVLKLNDFKFEDRVTQTVKEEYLIRAKYVSGETKEIYSDLENNLDRMLKLCKDKPRELAKFHTTKAITIFNAGTQANVIPPIAKIVVNCRLLAGDDYLDILEKFKKLAGPDFEITIEQGRNASNESRVDTKGYEVVTNTMLEMYPDCICIPSMVLGGTDARSYYPICDSVYRCSGYCYDDKDRGTHNFNENVPIKDLFQGPEYFYRLIKNYNK